MNPNVALVVLTSSRNRGRPDVGLSAQIAEARTALGLSAETSIVPSQLRLFLKLAKDVFGVDLLGDATMPPPVEKASKVSKASKSKKTKTVELVPDKLVDMPAETTSSSPS